MFEEDIFIGFARTLQDKTAIEGTQTIFECQLDSHTVKLPNLQIKWTKSGNEPISYLNTRTEQLPDGVLRLIIDPVSRNDVTKYKCTVSYEKSTVWTEAKLSVQGRNFSLTSTSFAQNILRIELIFVFQRLYPTVEHQNSSNCSSLLLPSLAVPLYLNAR
jgi:hypothetical protein